MVIVLAVLLRGWISVIPLGWQIYHLRKGKAEADTIWIIAYSHQLDLCYIMLGKSGYIIYFVLSLSYLK